MYFLCSGQYETWLGCRVRHTVYFDLDNVLYEFITLEVIE
jgi:hypothetical protein